MLIWKRMGIQRLARPWKCYPAAASSCTACMCVQLSARTPPWGAPSEVRGSGSDQQVRVAGISDSSSPVASRVPC